MFLVNFFVKSNSCFTKSRIIVFVYKHWKSTNQMIVFYRRQELSIKYIDVAVYWFPTTTTWLTLKVQFDIGPVFDLSDNSTIELDSRISSNASSYVTCRRVGLEKRPNNVVDFSIHIDQEEAEGVFFHHRTSQPNWFISVSKPNISTSNPGLQSNQLYKNHLQC